MGKAGKVLNPADKARKEARKKELKKNKKQRQQVRAAVIERHDPEKIISDLEKLDRFEYNPDTNHTISEVLYKEKRKRLKETWTKILDHYVKDDPNRHASLKKLENEYEQRHQKAAREYEAVKAAKEVRLEDIFLPPESDPALEEIADDDPLLSEDIYITPMTEGFKPPGCPPGMPPDLALLVSSLSNPILTPMQPIHPELMSLRPPTSETHATVMHPRGFNPNHCGARAGARGPARAGSKLEPRHDKSRAPPRDGEESNLIVKPAVIESKPVLFVPKATKFVPSSVMSKRKRVDSGSKPD